MSRSYLLIGSYYGGSRLASLVELLRFAALSDYSVVVNHQQGDQRRPRGFAAVYNGLIGLALADPACEFLWILGDDIKPQRHLFGELEQEMKADATIGAMVPTEAWRGKMAALHDVMPDLVTIDENTTAEVPLSQRLNGKREDILFPGFACCCIHRSAWDLVGPMDESLGRGYAEDLDWGIRCWQAGLRCVGSRSHYFVHERGATFNQLVKDGLFGADEPTKAAERVKRKYPFLWNGESHDVQVERMRQFRRAALEKRTAPEA